MAAVRLFTNRLRPKIRDGQEKVRADTFVVETDIHWPTESTLIRDGVRKVIELCMGLALAQGLSGWRQGNHSIKKVKKMSRGIERISSRKGPGYENRLKQAYRQLLQYSGKMIAKAEQLIEALVASQKGDLLGNANLLELKVFLMRTEQVRDTVRRRVLQGETVANQDKLFSMFEPHTQLYKRGKAGKPIQFGRLALVFEDAAGFIVHHHVLPRESSDVEVAVPQTRVLHFPVV